MSLCSPWKNRPQTLSRCFQALRIVVNDEINSLEETLNSIHQIIRPLGRLVIISYHSLEDRRVKNLFKYGNVQGEEYMDTIKNLKFNLYSNTAAERNSIWAPLFKRALTPSIEEIELNSRSRSAKLRVAEKKIDQGTSSRNDTDDKKKRVMGAKQLAKLLRQNSSDPEKEL